MKVQGDSLKEWAMRKEDLRNRGLVGLLKEVEYDSISLNSAIEIALLDADRAPACGGSQGQCGRSH